MLLQDLPVADKPIEDDYEQFPLYNGPRFISAAKKSDLVSLCVHLPEEKREYYRSLEACGEAEDSGAEAELEQAAIAEVTAEITIPDLD